MSARLPVTGAGAHVEIYPRLEIRQLQDDQAQFTLFILSWEKIMDPGFRPAAAQFEQIGGIHGMPYAPWLGDPDEETQTVRGPWLGYCNHGSIMFPNWHRPYVMLLEQVICDVAQGIAGQYASENPTQADTWLQAARELRFPFWDWTDPTTGTEGFPDIFQEATVQLLLPDATGVYDHRNILAYYKFNDQIDGFNNRLERSEIQVPPPLPRAMAYFREWDRTYRRPNSSPNAVTEDYGALDNDLTNPDPDARGSWANLTSDIAATFSLPIDIPAELWANAWDEYSNTTFQSSRPDNNGHPHSPYVWNIPPIEQPHNRVHLVVGGLGHMGDNDTAAFDPIFFLHHCNVDRLLAFWEHIYPDYVAGTEGYLDVDGATRVPFTQSGGTFIQTQTQPVDGESQLLPFRKSDYTYWNSNDTQALTLFDPESDPDNAVRNKYYTYLPIGGVDPNPAVPPTPEQRERERAILQKHFQYNPKKALKDYPTKLPTILPERLPWSVYGSIPRGLEVPKTAKKIEGYRQFVVTASLSPSYHNGSYSLNVVMQINQKSIFVGSIAVLGRGKSANCGNCQARRAAKTRVRGVLLVPHEHVVGVIEASPIEAPVPQQGRVSAESEAASVHGPANRLIQNLRISLSCHVVLPSGKVHSRLSKGGLSDEEGGPDETVPEVHLLSCDVYQDGEDAPFSFYNWLDHGLPHGKWAKVQK